MKRLLIFLLAFPFVLSGQKTIGIGEKHSLHSSLLNEERPYWVYLPPEYNDGNYGKAHYPVIYLLDGDTNFSLLVAIQQSFTRGMYNNMPECIIVGLPNTDRARDMTPSRSSVKHQGKDLFKNSGGAENFTAFLATELRREIDSTYRTNGYNLLIGHSLGGLFALNTLVHHTGLFNAYIALDPSLWWDSRKVYREAEAIWKTTDFGNCSLYIAMAKDEDRPDDTQQHSKTIASFCHSVLTSAPDNRLHAAWKYYEGEDHGTILIPGIFDGLRTIFRGIQLPVKQLPDHPELIAEKYAVLSERLGHPFLPDESLVDNIGKYALSIGRKESAIEIFTYNLKNYPDSANAKKRLEETKSTSHD